MPSTLPLIKEVVAVYERLIPILSLEKTAHFFGRVMNSSGEKKYTHLLANHFFVNKLPALVRGLHSLRNKTYAEVRGSLSVGSSRRKRLRRELYARLPRLHFYDEVLNDLFFLKKYGLHRTFNGPFTEIITRLQKENLASVYRDEDVIRYDNSFTFNSAFYSADLGIKKFEPEVHRAFRAIYFDSAGHLKAPLADDEFRSVIYSMTHIIIAHSRFYNRSVRGFNWILDFFVHSADEIINRTTTDILAEVALCFKLCQQENAHRKEVQKFRSILQKKLEAIPEQSTELLIKHEHQNSILFLVFYPNTRWHPSPNLARHPIFQSSPPFQW